MRVCAPGWSRASKFTRPRQTASSVRGPGIAAGSSVFTMWRAKPPLPPGNDCSVGLLSVIHGIAAETEGVGGEHVRANAEAIARSRHKKLSDRLLAQPELLHHELFHGDGIELVRGSRRPAERRA